MKPIRSSQPLACACIAAHRTWFLAISVGGDALLPPGVVIDQFDFVGCACCHFHCIVMFESCDRLSVLKMNFLSSLCGLPARPWGTSGNGFAIYFEELYSCRSPGYFWDGLKTCSS